MSVEDKKEKAPAKETKAVSEVTQIVEETQAAPELKLETKKIRFLLSPCGAFLLPYNVGQEVELPVNQADELVDCKYAEYVK